jgi:ABC-2 type transport system ATP-binding protein
MATPILRLHEVSKRYGEFAAVSGLGFEVPAGGIYGILGPNGAGKSTTLRMINDIIAPDAGRIELFGELTPGRQANRRIGYLPEERGLYPRMQVGELLTFFGEIRGLAPARAAAQGRAWLERLGIADRWKHRVQQLSKGMQQKVQFAAALVHEPELLILDEPWSGLDPLNAEVLRSVVREQCARGRTVLFSTHLMEQAEQICDRVCIIARGRKLVEGPLEELKERSGAGGRVWLAFVTGEGRARAEAGPLRDTALVSAVREHPNGLEVELRTADAAQPLLSRLVGAGVALRRFELAAPSLHEIFVAHVGGAAAAPGPLPAAPAVLSSAPVGGIDG